MAVTLAVLVARTRTKCRDDDDNNPTYDEVEYAQQVCDSFLTAASGLPAPVLYTASAFTISGDASTFTLPTTVPSGMASGAEYGPDIRIQLASSGTFLRKILREEMDRLWSGTTSRPGKPTRFALYETTAQGISGLTDLAPSSDEVCNLWRSMIEDDLRDAANLDAASVHFSRYGAAALVLHASASMVAKMRDEDLRLRKLNGAVAKQWFEESRRMFYQEEMRRHDMESTGNTHQFVP